MAGLFLRNSLLRKLRSSCSNSARASARYSILCVSGVLFIVRMYRYTTIWRPEYRRKSAISCLRVYRKNSTYYVHPLVVVTFSCYFCPVICTSWYASSLLAIMQQMVILGFYPGSSPSPPTSLWPPLPHARTSRSVWNKIRLTVEWIFARAYQMRSTTPQRCHGSRKTRRLQERGVNWAGSLLIRSVVSSRHCGHAFSTVPAHSLTQMKEMFRARAMKRDAVEAEHDEEWCRGCQEGESSCINHAQSLYDVYKVFNGNAMIIECGHEACVGMCAQLFIRTCLSASLS